MNENPKTDADTEFEQTVVEEENTLEVKIQLDNTDNIGDVSVEINVEELLNQIAEESGDQDASASASARRRLDEIMEIKRAQKELDDDDYLDETENFSRRRRSGLQP